MKTNQTENKRLEAVVKKHTEIFGKDLGSELGSSFVNSFYQQLYQSNPNPSPEEVEASGANIFQSLARNTYGPLLCYFTDWMLKGYSKSGKNGKVLFLARDSIPLFNIAKILIKNRDYQPLTSSNLGLIYYTRSLAGEADEIAGINQRNVNGKVSKYLMQEGLNQDALLVDMGMYGSLYCKGSGLFWDRKINPALVFFYSKNPNILGFLNLVFGDYKGNMTQRQKDLSNILVDGTECVNPQKYWSPGELIESDSKMIPELIEIKDQLVQRWHQASIKGYQEAAEKYIHNRSIDLHGELEKLQKLSDLAKQGIWTGVLPHITPEWSLKNDFLNNTPRYKERTGKKGWNLGLAKPFGTKEIAFYTGE